MSEFFVGQKVVCVNDADQGAPPLIKRGGIYTVRWLGDYLHPIVGLYTGLRVDGVVRADMLQEDCPFYRFRFRPLESKSIQLFRSIAQGVTDGKPIVEDVEYCPSADEFIEAMQDFYGFFNAGRPML